VKFRVSLALAVKPQEVEALSYPWWFSFIADGERIEVPDWFAEWQNKLGAVPSLDEPGRAKRRR